MEFLGNIFHILDLPILHGLTFLYEKLPGHDFGIAIIIVTLLLRVILHPLSMAAFKSQKAQVRIQEKVRAIQEQYKGKRDEIAKRLLELYRQEKINPFASFLPLVPQIFVFISLFTVLKNFEQDQAFSHIDPSFLSIVPLDEKFLPLALAAGLSQFFQSKHMLSVTKSTPSTAKSDFPNNIQTIMVYFLPVVTVFAGASFPGALSLYWTTSNVFSIVQQWYFIKQSNPSTKSQNANP